MDRYRAALRQLAGAEEPERSVAGTAVGGQHRGQEAGVSPEICSAGERVGIVGRGGDQAGASAVWQTRLRPVDAVSADALQSTAKCEYGVLIVSLQ